MTKTTISFLSVLVAISLGMGAGCSQSPESDESAPGPASGGGAAKQGEEHPGEEHPGEGAEGEEHPGEEHSGEGAEGEEHPGEGSESKEAPQEGSQDQAAASQETFNATQIKEAMREHINARMAEGEAGVFEIRDEETGEDLQLEFVQIHDPVRKIEGKGYFACTDFAVAGEPEKLYDLDFWLNPENGQLTVTDTRIHKHPAQVNGDWEKEPRYTFQDDEPVAVQN